jgi:hypothetical protein
MAASRPEKAPEDQLSRTRKREREKDSIIVLEALGAYGALKYMCK